MGAAGLKKWLVSAQLRNDFAQDYSGQTLAMRTMVRFITMLLEHRCFR